MSKTKFDEAIEARDRQDRLDAFAAAALTGLLAFGVPLTMRNASDDTQWGEFAANSYAFAEAMEAERTKRLAK